MMLKFLFCIAWWVLFTLQFNCNKVNQYNVLWQIVLIQVSLDSSFGSPQLFQSNENIAYLHSGISNDLEDTALGREVERCEIKPWYISFFFFSFFLLQLKQFYLVLSNWETNSTKSLILFRADKSLYLQLFLMTNSFCQFVQKHRLSDYLSVSFLTLFPSWKELSLKVNIKGHSIRVANICSWPQASSASLDFEGSHLTS